MTQVPVAPPAPARPAPGRGLRGSLGMIGASLRLVWAASRRDFLIVTAMDVLQACGIFVFVMQIQGVLSGMVAGDNGHPAAGLWLKLTVFIGANVGISVAEAVIGNRRTLLGERTGIYARQEVLKVACLAELDDFDDSRFHDRLQRAATSATTRPMTMVSALTRIGQALFTLAALWFSLVRLEPWIGIGVLAVALPVWIGGTRGGQQYFEFVRQTTPTDRNRNYLFQLLTSRDPAKEIRAFNLAGHLTTTWTESMYVRLGMLRKTLSRRLRSSLISSLGSNLVLALVALGLIALNHYKVLSFAATAAVAGVLLIFAQKLGEAVAATNDFFESAPLVVDFNDFLALGPGLKRVRDGRPFAAGFDQIDVEDVHFTYAGAEREALGGVSLTVRAGEVVALVGENGSGKTTLAKILAGLYPPRTGVVRVDGVDLGEYDATDWRNSVAVLFQDYIRYALSAADNIHLGAATRPVDLAELRDAARAAGADDYLSVLPEGYDTILSPQFGEGLDLSLGQWQRVALARAFYRDAPLVILDEPSASLDARAERALFDSVRDLYKGRTVLLISHRFSTVRTADQIIVLNGGKVVEQGSHASLMAEDGLYAELFSIQAAGFLEDEAEGEAAADGLDEAKAEAEAEDEGGAAGEAPPAPSATEVPSATEPPAAPEAEPPAETADQNHDEGDRDERRSPADSSAAPA